MGPQSPAFPNPNSRLGAARSTSQQPSTPLDKVEGDLRTIISLLLELSIGIYGYTPPTSSEVLSTQLNKLSTLLSSPTFPPPDLSTTLPREIIQYVSQGRNPDIYTREFVEIVQKQNMVMKGRMEAFKGFREVLAEGIERAFPELREEVGRVIEETGGRGGESK